MTWRRECIGRLRTEPGSKPPRLATAAAGNGTGGECHGTRHIFIAGRYSGTYSGADVGITQNGFELEQDSDVELLNDTDAVGGTVLDWVYRGGTMFIQFESKAYKSGSIAPFWPYGALGVLGVIGRLASDIAAAMVLTSTAGTPAVASPASLTATKSLLAPNNPARLLFTSKVRNVPVRLQLLAYDSGGGVLKWLTTT